jgi:hypothetical protein
LVGCDEEAILAIETAILLAPTGQVAGLVLCGDLTEANQQAQQQMFRQDKNVMDDVDTFLKDSLECPFVIIWDGGTQSSVVSGSSVHDAIERRNNPSGTGTGGSSTSSRCVILGGGSVPHRTKPEQFAWILTRFVEEKVQLRRNNQPPRHAHRHSYRTYSEDDMTTDDDETDYSSAYDDLDRFSPLFRPPPPINNNNNNRGILRTLNLPFGINSLVSPEGRLLLGRAVAAALFYISIAKVLMVQYKTVRSGFMSIRSGVDSVQALRRKVFHTISAFVVNFGYVPRLFKFSFQRAREVDDDDDDVNDDDDKMKQVPPRNGPPATNQQNDDTEQSTGTGGENYGSRMDDETNELEEEEDNRPKFKPLFFLDNIIT